MGKSTLITSLIKESFIPNVSDPFEPQGTFCESAVAIHYHLTWQLMWPTLDSTCRSRGDHTSGSYARKMHDPYYGLFWYLTSKINPVKIALEANASTLTAARPENREQLETEIRKAHVICIVYAINDPNTFNRLPLFWLPYIRSLGVNVRFLASFDIGPLQIFTTTMQSLFRSPAYWLVIRSICVVKMLPIKIWKMKSFLLWTNSRQVQ